jgi:glutathione synthase/RimK-type ligase-like ATP-grasp enzyme
MQKTVLVLASKDDVHALAVQKCLHKLGAAVRVLYREDCFVNWSLDCYDDDIVIIVENQRFSQNDISSVYLRKDYLIEPRWILGDNLTDEEKTFLAEQREIHVESSLRRLTQSCLFVNSISANRQCQSKVLQHYVARRCGLNVPRTYVGNDPKAAESFARNLWNNGNRCCTKNLESTHVAINGTIHSRFTQLFEETNLQTLNGLPVCPMIFQEYICKRFEYRATVVGKEVFACQIDSQAAGGETAVDWRNYNLPLTPHRVARLDTKLNDSLVMLIHDLGIVYGAVDLIEDINGCFYFLEVNSMGQWLWIEDLTGMPISMAIARTLCNG